MSEQIINQPPLGRVRQLLRDNDLPSDDLTDEHLEHFLGLEQDGELVGVVGLEPHGSEGLLRSLVVDISARGTGAGKALTDAIERAARDQGVTHMYLLTETAQVFFARLGYDPIDRDKVPETIRNTAEFSSLCPDTAVVMAKPL